ncbi:putative di-trans,poly-cis-decaprenylcistransferase [Proteus penneri ATCC 35198]|nr:putative di-trans,poly-cis-decaprenylcistransferase [Proteus penneri ATCC 35198]
MFFALDNEVKSLHKHNVKLTVIGDISRFSRRLQDRIKSSVALTANNTGLNLNIAANYGGRWDITQSVKQLATSLAKGEISLEDINENAISSHLCLHNQPDVDLVIRTGGEHRISNFLIWQIAYAELYFTQVLWPDFDEQVFQNALDAFAKRERRFGGTTSETDTINLGG